MNEVILVRHISKNRVRTVAVQEITHSWSSALLEKLPIGQLLKNFPAFYGT
jgi:hypothetical protein